MGGQRATASSEAPDVSKALDLIKPKKRPAKKATGSIRPATKANQRTAVVRVRNQAHIDALLDPDTLREWDDEELERGQRKDKNGRFTGRPPAMIPAEVHMEIRRRSLAALDKYIVEQALDVAKALVEVALNGEDERAQVAAAKLVLDRAAGVPGSHSVVDVRHQATPRFAKVLEAGIVSTDEDDSDIVDAEIIE